MTSLEDTSLKDASPEDASPDGTPAENAENASPKCLAVMYHYVRDRVTGPDREIKGVSEDGFRRQLDILCDTLTPIDWPTLVSWRMGRSELPGDSFLLTFDDGLSDHAEVVFPILEERGIRGVFFVSTGLLVEKRMNSAHQIHMLLCRMGAGTFCREVREWLRRKELSHLADSVEGTLETLRAYSYETPERAEIKHLLTQVLPLEIGRQLVNDLFEMHVGDQVAFAEEWYLGWDDLKRMEDAGHTVGGHGDEHHPYRRMSAMEQARDMNRCAMNLREVLGDKPRPFSYPYGDADGDVARRCAFAGFVNGFTTRQGWVRATDDAHSLSRVDTIHVDALLERIPIVSCSD